MIAALFFARFARSAGFDIAEYVKGNWTVEIRNPEMIGDSLEGAPDVLHVRIVRPDKKGPVQLGIYDNAEAETPRYTRVITSPTGLSFKVEDSDEVYEVRATSRMYKGSGSYDGYLFTITFTHNNAFHVFATKAESGAVIDMDFERIVAPQTLFQRYGMPALMLLGYASIFFVSKHFSKKLAAKQQPAAPSKEEPKKPKVEVVETKDLNEHPEEEGKVEEEEPKAGEEEDKN